MKKINCLIIDDDTKIRESIKSFIEEFFPQWIVAESANGKDGINFIDKNPIDIVITDYEMSPKNGLDVLEHIFLNKLKIDTIMITSHANPVTWKGSIKFRVSGFIEKPINPATLIDLLNTLNTEIIEKTQQSTLADLGKNSAMILHDIRNPLAVIIGSSSLLKRKSIDEKAIQFATKVEQQSKTILDIISQAQNNLHSSINNLDTEKTNTDELADLLKEFVLYKYPDLKFDISFGDSIIPMNKVHSYQILTNLINNSIDAISDQEKSDQWIKLNLIKEISTIKILVTDSGLGIPASEVPKLFDKLYSKKKNQLGTGFGLSIVKDIIQSHSGSISYNENSTNTQFIITLPL